jgi:phosphatidylserine decarboxylase
MALAREGIREMTIATLVLGGLTALAIWLYPWAAVVPLLLWVLIIVFFRDPRRVALFARGELCSPADGRVRDITRLEHHEAVGGPAIRIGIFLSILDVHANRAPCRGRVVSIDHRKGSFLDARHAEAGNRNEAKTLVLDPDPPVAGPIVVRQVAGMVARRIVCHAREGDDLMQGERYGMIKFGSRTELIVPDLPETEIKAYVGQPVRAGITVLVVQRSHLNAGVQRVRHRQTESAR